MASPTKRSKQLKLTVTPDLYERLQRLADSFGVAPATIATVAVGQYVAERTRSQEVAQDAAIRAVEKIAPELVDLFKAEHGMA